MLAVGILVAVLALGATAARGASVTVSLFGSRLGGWGSTSTTETIPGPAVTVNQNDAVTVALTSTDGLSHQLLIDYNHDGFASAGEPLSGVFSSNTQISFTASVAGSFTYFCTIHQTTMYGTWTTSSSNTPPTVGALSATPVPAIPGQKVTFSATASDSNGDVLSYTLTFGDGTSASGSTPGGGGPISASHAYAADGGFTAVLTVNDGHGGTASSSAVVSVSTSFLRVTTNPAVPGKIIVDGVPRDEWGLTWMKIAPGPHTVSFGDLYGFGTPAAQSVTTTAGATTEVVGNYVAYGSLRVITSPALPATISVNGQPANDWGMWRAAAPGTYTISCGKVADYAPPADQTATVTAGALATATCSYTSSPGAPGPDPTTYGYLRVTTNPAVPSQILVDGIPRDEWGLTWVKIALGTHTVAFTSVYGVTPPAPKTVTVTAGATTVYDGVFTVHGSLRIITNPALPATVFVDGIPRNDWGMWQSMPPGTYTVSFGPVPGYVTPAAQTISVVANALQSITGNYVVASTAASVTARAPDLAAFCSGAIVCTATSSEGATWAEMVARPSDPSTDPFGSE